MKEIVTYLTFDGNCREAMTFYKECLGAELALSPFSDMPGDQTPAAQAPAVKDRIMHAKLEKGSVALMASDTMPGMPLKQGNNFSIAVMCESAGKIDRLFAEVGQGGKITMPLQDQFWGARFGGLTDRFGIQWMFNFDKPKA